MPLTLSKKVLLLVSVPVCLELFLVARIFKELHETQEARQKSTHARILTSHLNALMSMYILRVSKLVARKLTTDDVSSRDEHVLGALSKEHIDALTELTRGDLAEKQHWDNVLEHLSAMDKHTVAASEAYSSGNKLTAALESNATMSQMAKMFRSSQELEKEQRSAQTVFDDELTRGEESVRNTLQWSILASVLIAFGSAVVFNRSTTSRLAVLTNNAVSLFSGQRPPKKLTGSDELKQLDDIYHDMYAELQRLRRKERAVLDNAGDVICSISKNLKLQEFNQSAVKLLGFDQERLRELAIAELIDEASRQRTVDALLSTIANHSQTTFETKMVCADRNYVETAWSATWSSDEGSLICVIHDITQRKELEQLKRDFINMLSHDLRTPLSSALISLEILSHPAQQLTESAKETLVLAEQNLTSSIDLISELLEIEKMETGTIELDLDETSVRMLVESACDTVRTLADSEGIRLVPVTATNAPFEADAARLKRVLVNLLANAIKFSPRDSEITVRQTIAEENGRDVMRFEVVDQGRGVPTDQQSSIFERFRQANPRDAKERSGTGLGLAICKAIVNAHHGSIGVTSDGVKGSVFWFTVPLEQAASERSRRQ